MKTSVHDNSIAAYIIEEQRFSARAAAIINWVAINGASTDRQIMSGMGFKEPNSVRPRITELIALNQLEEIASTRCPVTGKTVRIVDIPRPGQRALFS